MHPVVTGIILSQGWARRGYAFAAGALLVLTLAPFDFILAGFPAFIVLLWLLDGATPAAESGLLGRLSPSFATGWWFGFGYFLAGLWWIGPALTVQNDGLVWAVPLVALAMALLLAPFIGFGCLLSRLFWSDGPGRVLALAAGLAVSEILRGTILSGFPWNALGYALAPHPVFMQATSLVGIEGYAALAVLVFAAPALLVDARARSAAVVIPVLVLVGITGFGFWQLSGPTPEDQARRLAVRIVQPAIEQGDKWDEARRDEIFETLLDLSRAEPREDDPRPDWIIWPETALPFLLEQKPDALTRIAEILQADQVLMTGAVRVEGEGGSARFYNSVIAINGDGEIIGATDKVHLVPFGEYLPGQSVLGALFDRLGLDQLAEAPGDFSAGARHGPILETGSAPLNAVALICYEMIFPSLVRDAAANAEILINVTNDAWYGRTPGPYQHFRQAQLRAVELGLPLVRVANTGLSAVLDGKGRIMSGLALDATGILDVTVGAGAGGTVYARHGRAATLAMIALLVVCALGFKLLMRRRR